MSSFLILTFADASAALIGIFYGRFQYSTSEGAKTLEGSLVFFQTAFLSALIPILLFTTIGRAETLMIALLMALLAMLLDAWPTLPEPVKAGILAMVKAAKGKNL
ncbi:hypothetical protein LCGC14_2249190 [marine sediment metagenome]|uniref:Uncharacterized protein n=1 Tax=marine sediment metagenome TaxID=412755 RepID=A0A0F9FY25_9ZZZZ